MARIRRFKREFQKKPDTIEDNRYTLSTEEDKDDYPYISSRMLTGESKDLWAGMLEAEQEQEYDMLKDDPEIIEHLKDPEQREEIEQLKGTGILIPEEVLASISGDFEGMEVYLHNDEAAAFICDKINARAFAYDNHIFLAKDEYQPDTKEYNILLAHELMHIYRGYNKKIKRQVKKQTNSKPVQDVTPVIRWKDQSKDILHMNIKSKADLIVHIKEVNDFIQVETLGAKDNAIEFYYKNIYVGSGTIRHEGSKGGYILEKRKTAAAYNNVPDTAESEIQQTPENKALPKSETQEQETSKYPEVDESRYKIIKTQPRIVIESTDKKNKITNNEAYLIIAKLRRENKNLELNYPRRTASQTNNGLTAPKFIQDGKIRDYYFPDKQKPDKTPVKDKFAGEEVNQPGFVKAQNGIRLHETPSNTDPRYVDKKEDSQKVYPTNEPITILYKGDEKHKDWRYIRTKDGKEGWIEQRFTGENIVQHASNKKYKVKEGDNATMIVKSQIKDFERETGKDDRSLVHALLIVNEGNSGVYINQKKYAESVKENALLNSADPTMAKTRVLYQSVEVKAGAEIIIPTKEDVDRLIKEGKIGSRPEWMDEVIAAGKSVIGFEKGYYKGLYEAGKGMTEDTIDMIKDIVTGDIISQTIDMVQSVWDMGPEGVWKAIEDMAGQKKDEFLRNWNNPNPEQKWEYMGKLVGMMVFEVGLAIVTAGAGNYLKNIPRVKKILDKLPKLKNIFSKKAPDIDKKKSKATVPPILLMDKVLETLLAPFEKLRKKLPGVRSVLGNKQYKKFEDYLRTLPESVLKKLDADPALVEKFAERSLRDPDFAKAVKGGDLDKIDELKNVSKLQRTLAVNKPDPNAKPRGRKTELDKNDKQASGKRGVDRENESAEILAKNGYDIEQNPVISGTKKNPDYRINGKVFDNKAPGPKKSPRNIASDMEEELLDGQADNFVLNLNDWDGNINDLKKQLKDWPIQGLKEVIAIKGNKIMHIYP